MPPARGRPHIDPCLTPHPYIDTDPPLNNTLTPSTPSTLPSQAFLIALRCCQPGRDAALRPKILVNLGITQEAEGLLMSACDYYRSVVVCVCGGGVRLGMGWMSGWVGGGFGYKPKWHSTE